MQIGAQGTENLIVNMMLRQKTFKKRLYEKNRFPFVLL
jgi:hypothetical protein